MNGSLTVKSKLSLGSGAVIFLMIAVSINTFINISKVKVVENSMKISTLANSLY